MLASRSPEVCYKLQYYMGNVLVAWLGEGIFPPPSIRAGERAEYPKTAI
jgi:hypothetical protein